MTPEELAEIEARAQAASPGPWVWVDNGFEDDPPEKLIDHGWQHQGPDLVRLGDWSKCFYCCQWADGVDTSRGKQGTPGHEHRAREAVVSSWGYDADGLIVKRADAVFIARAREDIPKLIAEVRRLKGTS
jgi:hypothetical protein